MKKTIFLLFISLSLVSCVDLFLDDDIDYPDSEATVHDITFGNSPYTGNPRLFEKNLGEFSYDRSAVFSIQGNHFEISELDRNFETGEIIFRYKPKEGYVGEDYVEIIKPTTMDGQSIYGVSKTLEFYFKMR